MKCRDRANRIIAREQFKLIEKKEKELFWGTQTWQRPLIPFRDEPIYFEVLTGFLDNFTAFWAAKKTYKSAFQFFDPVAVHYSQ